MENAIDNLSTIKHKSKQEIERWRNKPLNLETVDDTGEHYRLIYTLRSGKEPKKARSEVVSTIEEIGRRWREKLKELGFENPQNIYLSITSLYRDEELQKQLQAKTGNASNTSSHLLGAAADIDPNGFYLKQENEFKSINDKNYDQTKIAMLRDSLLEILDQMEQEELISFIKEYKQGKESGYSCFHICPNPK
jgi:uncharacterized protein YcbK (DUF882 family)